MAWVCSPYKPMKAAVMEEMCIKDKIKKIQKGKKNYEKYVQKNNTDWSSTDRSKKKGKKKNEHFRVSAMISVI